MTTLDRSKQMNLVNEDLARSHRNRRWRGHAAPLSRVARQNERAQNARLVLARMLYGGHGR